MQNDSPQRPQRKVCLRLALSQKGRPRVERIFSSPQAITVGTRDGCTFQLSGDGVPESFVVLAPEGDLYQLQFQPGMKGWVSLDEGGDRIDLSSPTEDRRFQRLDDGCAVQLAASSQGKVTIGPASLLFQFIEDVEDEEDEDSTEEAGAGASGSEPSGASSLAIAPASASAAAGVATPAASKIGEAAHARLVQELAESMARASAAAKERMEADLAPVREAASQAARALEAAITSDKAARAEVSELEAELDRLKARLDEASGRASASATLLERAKVDLEAARNAERKATEAAQRQMEEDLRKQREEAESAALARIAADATTNTSEAMEQAAAAAASELSAGLAPFANDAGAEEEDDEDIGPLVLPDYSLLEVSKDHLFGRITGALLVANAAIMTAIMLSPTPEPEELTLEDIPERFASVIIPDKPKEEPVVADEPGKEEAPAPEEKKASSESKGGDSSQETKKYASNEERKAAIREGVQGKGLLKLLGALGGDGSEGDAIQDVLGGGSSASNDIAAALMGASGVGVATSESIARQAGQRLGGGSGDVASIGDLGTSGGAGAQASKVEEKKTVTIRGRVIDEGPDVESSDCDKNVIARFVKQRMKAIQGCYEKELKKNPTLKGKLVVRFTIDERGKVRELEIEENTIGNQAVVACIRNTIKIWNFPIKDNECPVAYPFIFTPSS